MKFLQNRIKVFPNGDDHRNSFYWKYLVYEVLYLWNALGNVSFEQLDRIIDGEFLWWSSLWSDPTRIRRNNENTIGDNFLS